MLQRFYNKHKAKKANLNKEEQKAFNREYKNLSKAQDLAYLKKAEMDYSEMVIIKDFIVHSNLILEELDKYNKEVIYLSINI